MNVKIKNELNVDLQDYREGSQTLSFHAWTLLLQGQSFRVRNHHMQGLNPQRLNNPSV